MNGAPTEALDTLKADAKVNLDDIRDKAAETANCSPEARSSKQALESKLQSYRKALADMESARQQVARENLAGDFMEGYSRGAGVTAGYKATADAAMELFGATASMMSDSPLKTGMERVGAAYNVATGVVALNNTSGTLAEGFSGSTSIMAGGLKLAGLQTGVDPGGAKQAAAYAAGFEVAGKSVDTVALNSEPSSGGRAGRIGENIGNALQIGGTITAQIGELPGGSEVAKAAGTAYAAVGTVISSATKYDRELDKAFGTIAAGKDEKREYDALSESTMRQIAAKRVEFMEKIAALEAEIGRSGCVK